MYLEKRRSSPVFHCFKHGFAPLPDLWKLVTGEVYIYIQYNAINDDVDVDAKGDSGGDYES